MKKVNNQEFGDALEALVVKANKGVTSVLFSYFPSNCLVRVFYKTSESFGLGDRIYIPSEFCQSEDLCFEYLQSQKSLR